MASNTFQDRQAAYQRAQDRTEFEKEQAIGAAEALARAEQEAADRSGLPHSDRDRFQEYCAAQRETSAELDSKRAAAERLAQYEQEQVDLSRRGRRTL